MAVLIVISLQGLMGCSSFTEYERKSVGSVSTKACPCRALWSVSRCDGLGQRLAAADPKNGQRQVQITRLGGKPRKPRVTATSPLPASAPSGLRAPEPAGYRLLTPGMKKGLPAHAFHLPLFIPVSPRGAPASAVSASADANQRALLAVAIVTENYRPPPPHPFTLPKRSVIRAKGNVPGKSMKNAHGYFAISRHSPDPKGKSGCRGRGSSLSARDEPVHLTYTLTFLDAMTWITYIPVRDVSVKHVVSCCESLL